MTTLSVTFTGSDASGKSTALAWQEDNNLKGVKARDPRCLESMIREHGPRMYAVARRLLRCEQDAADAVQDAFVSAMQSIDTFREESRLSTWLHRVTVNVCLMKIRSRSREKAAHDRLKRNITAVKSGSRNITVSDPAERLGQMETHQYVRECIDRLPDNYRQVLILRDIQQLSTQEVADMLGVSLVSIKTRLHRARLALRGMLSSSNAAISSEDAIDTLVTLPI